MSNMLEPSCTIQDMGAPPCAAQKCELMSAASCVRQTTMRMPLLLGGMMNACDLLFEHQRLQSRSSVRSTQWFWLGPLDLFGFVLSNSMWISIDFHCLVVCSHSPNHSLRKTEEAPMAQSSAGVKPLEGTVYVWYLRFGQCVASSGKTWTSNSGVVCWRVQSCSGGSFLFFSNTKPSGVVCYGGHLSKSEIWDRERVYRRFMGAVYTCKMQRYILHMHAHRDELYVIQLCQSS